MFGEATIAEVTAAAQEDSEELLLLAKAGDSDAFGVLCRQHEARLLRQAGLLCSDAGEAEDLAQETMIAAWKSIQRFHGGCRFFTWLCAILLNLHRNRRRRAWFWRWMTKRSAETDLALLPDENPTSLEQAQRQEEWAQARRLLQRLPRKQREVLALRFFADESLAGIAAALNCSVGTVKSRLFHGLEKLRKMSKQ